MIWTYEKNHNEHNFRLKGKLDNEEGWQSLQRQMLLLLDPKPQAVIRLTLDCTQLEDSGSSGGSRKS